MFEKNQVFEDFEKMRFFVYFMKVGIKLSVESEQNF